MADITLTEFEQRLAALGSGGLVRALVKGARPIALQAEAESKLLATTRLRVRTGNLRGSINGGVEQKPDGLELYVQAGGARGSASKPVKYAAIQELGGTTQRRFPNRAALTPAGVQRQSPEDAQHLFSAPKAVKIKPKHYLRDGLKKAAQKLPPLLEGVVDREVRIGHS